MIQKQRRAKQERQVFILCSQVLLGDLLNWKWMNPFLKKGRGMPRSRLTLQYGGIQWLLWQVYNSHEPSLTTLHIIFRRNLLHHHHHECLHFKRSLSEQSEEQEYYYNKQHVAGDWAVGSTGSRHDLHKQKQGLSRQKIWIQPQTTNSGTESMFDSM